MGRLTRVAPAALVVAGAGMALLLLLPHRSRPFRRADGQTVQLLSGLSHTSDAWDYLQLGRRLASGDGFTSRFTYVPFLPESVPSGDGEVRAFPLFWRQPGYPLLVAAALGIAGRGNADGLLWVAGVAMALLPWAVYLLGRRVLSPGWAALAALWTLLTPAALGETAPMVATSWFVLLIALLFAAAPAARRPAAWAGAGVLLGLAALLRLETWLLVPGLLLARRGSPRFRVSAAVMLGVALLLVLPWHLRLWSLTGNPVYSAGSLLFHDTPPFPGWDASRTLAVRDLSAVAFLQEHGGAVIRKTVLDLARFGRDLMLLPSPFLALVFWLGVLRPAGQPRARWLVLGAAAAAVVLLLALAPLEYARRFLAPLVPLLAVGAAHTLTRLPRHRRLLAGAATVVGLAMTAGNLPVSAPDGSAGPAAEDLNRLLSLPQAAPLATEAVALTDSPTVYAWIWDRPAVWAPLPRDLPRVRERLPGSIGLFTRARGRGDSMEATVVADYADQGGRVIEAGEAALVEWPRRPVPGGAR